MIEPTGMIKEVDPSVVVTGATGDRVRASNKGERTRERIKFGFSALLNDKSFAAITISDICRSSGITVGGFYFHFASQEALLDEVMGEHIGRLIADVEAALIDAALLDAGGEAAASAVCRAFLAAYSERNGLARTFQQLTRMRVDYAARWREASTPAIARLGQALERSRADLIPERARFLAYSLVAMIISKLDQVYVYRGLGRAAGHRPVDDIEQDLVRTWMRLANGPGAE
jgi:AcrR family transcriptional regulator